MWMTALLCFFSTLLALATTSPDPSFAWIAAIESATHTAASGKNKTSATFGPGCDRPCRELAVDALSALHDHWYEPELGFLGGAGLWNVANTAEAVLNLVERKLMSNQTGPMARTP